MIGDYFSISFKSISRRRLRSWLTVLGIIIGIAAVVSLISIGQGMQTAINEQFKKVGYNRIIVSPGGRFFGPGDTAELSVERLTDNDVKLISNVKGIEYAVGVLSKNAKVEFRNEVQYVNVMGFPTDSEGARIVEDIGFFDIEQGRQLKSTDKYRAVLGSIIARDYFDKEVVVGNKIDIKDKKFEVIGIQKKSGTGIHDVILRVPLEVARDLFNEPNEISTIFATVKETYDATAVAEDVKKVLRKDRGQKEGEETFSVQTAEQTIAQLNTILGVVQAVLVGIAAISLLVGGIGIMNTMYTGVLERTMEIGIMKSIGARNSHILLIFLIEAGIFGLVGGSVGIAIGIGLSKVAEFAASLYDIPLKITISFGLISFALFFSFLIGSLAGILPARQASKLTPVEALVQK